MSSPMSSLNASAAAGPKPQLETPFAVAAELLAGGLNPLDIYPVDPVKVCAIVAAISERANVSGDEARLAIGQTLHAYTVLASSALAAKCPSSP